MYRCEMILRKITIAGEDYKNHMGNKLIPLLKWKRLRANMLWKGNWRDRVVELLAENCTGHGSETKSGPRSPTGFSTLLCFTQTYVVDSSPFFPLFTIRMCRVGMVVSWWDSAVTGRSRLIDSFIKNLLNPLDAGMMLSAKDVKMCKTVLAWMQLIIHEEE